MSIATEFTAEIWATYSIAVTFTGLRMFARVRSVGWKHLEADDFLACAALMFYTAQTGIAHVGSNLYDSAIEEGVLLTPDGAPGGGPPPPEAIAIRIKGSKLHFSAWPMYTSTLWLLKASLLVLYQRLTTGLAGNYRMRILIGFGLLIGTWIIIFLTLCLGCRPFSNYFADFPTGGMSKPVVWTCYTFNVLTDLYLISLPAPMLWMSSMKTWKKLGLLLLFSGGFLVIAFATVRCVLLTTAVGNQSPVAGAWSVREAFVAIITANLPMAFTLIKGMLGPSFRSTKGSSGTELKESKYGYSSKSRKSHRVRGGPNADPTATNMLFSESEERIYKEEALQGSSSSEGERPSQSGQPSLQVAEPPRVFTQLDGQLAQNNRPLPPLPKEDV